MKNRNISVKQALVIVPLVLIGIVVLGGTIAELSDKKETSAPVATQQAYVFDVPSLIGMDVDGVKTALGTPTDDSEPTAEQMAGTSEWWKEFKHNGETLLVTYNPHNRVVIDFFISAKGESSKKTLLETGNLKENDSRYRIEFVSALNDSSIFTGVKIIPNP